MTRRHVTLLLLLLLMAFPALAAAPTIAVQSLRMWRAPDNTRLVFDLSGDVTHQIFVLENPPRIVIDLEHTTFRGKLPEVESDNTLLSAIRSGKPEGDTQRFVLDLKRSVNPRSFLLKPAGQYGYRLVLDLVDPQADVEEEQTAQEGTPAPIPEVAPPTPVPTVPLAKREWIIAIDAGHGGEDPGARGRTFGTREKDVTLAIARELARQVTQEPGMRAALIRDGDYFVPLGRRFQLARRHRADIFVSIHADALPGRRVAYGSSVYALSERGATNALAHALADQENYSDLVGGVSLTDKTDDVKRTLLDLSQEKSVEHSLQLGEDVLTELRQVGQIHLARVAQANFAVLKSPDIPSVLVETAFISTPAEERKLRDTAYRQKLAAAILKGVKRFLDRNGQPLPLPTQVAEETPGEHVVQSGETLFSIAQRYNVSVDVLRFLNNLGNEEVSVGLHLRLPGSGG